MNGENKMPEENPIQCPEEYLNYVIYFLRRGRSAILEQVGGIDFEEVSSRIRSKEPDVTSYDLARRLEQTAKEDVMRSRALSALLGLANTEEERKEKLKKHVLECEKCKREYLEDLKRESELIYLWEQKVYGPGETTDADKRKYEEIRKELDIFGIL